VPPGIGQPNAHINAVVNVGRLSLAGLLPPIKRQQRCFAAVVCRPAGRWRKMVAGQLKVSRKPRLIATTNSGSTGR
jgi:hypothetical protein